MPYKIINWKKWQSRSDRSRNPWVKLWKDLLKSDDFFDLPENIRWQWPCLLLLAQNLTGVINKTDKQIARQFNIESFDAKPFIPRLLEVVENGNHVVNKKNHVVFPSVSVSVSNKEEKGSRRLRSDYPEDFIGFWEICPKTGSKKRAAAQWAKAGSKKRADMVVAMVAQTKWRAAWEEADPDHFVPSWKDMERWIRDDRYTDVLDQPVVKPQSFPAELHRYGDRPGKDASDAEMAEWLGVSECDYVAEKERMNRDNG
ncbi:hypothetical protein LCGC14_1318560 [marine sediment metagenome]|uniref:Uncharacterized protein n=1 Tax=marine sediment metagenome TaxID=412755 RepID=A0A0F9NMH6_9ZZZZ